MHRFVNMLLAIAAIFALAGCGESESDRLAREARERVAIEEQAEKERVAALVAAEENYYSYCKNKNGDRHWGPFTAHHDYRNPYVWYKNGRAETIKRRVASMTAEVWKQAKKKGACVVAPRGSGSVVLSLDTGAQIERTMVVPRPGVPMKEWEKKVKRVSEVFISF